MEMLDLCSLIEDRNEFLRRLYFILVGKNYRSDRVGITRIPINDTLEVQFKLNVSDLLKDCTICVNDSLLDYLNISHKELIGQAVDNTQEMCPYLLQTLEEAIHIDIPELTDFPMYVLTNKQCTFGAGAILYPGMKQRIEEMIGDFVVIPSSIHETILIPESLNTPGLTEMIQEVNSTVVSDCDILSDRPYKLIEDMVLREIIQQ